MATKLKRKVTYGSAYIDHFSPPLPSEVPKAMNVTLSFEEALASRDLLPPHAQSSVLAWWLAFGQVGLSN